MYLIKLQTDRRAYDLLRLTIGMQGVYGSAQISTKVYGPTLLELLGGEGVQFPE